MAVPFEGPPLSHEGECGVRFLSGVSAHFSNLSRPKLDQLLNAFCAHRRNTLSEFFLPGLRRLGESNSR
jgi:hypothetical protein